MKETIEGWIARDEEPYTSSSEGTDLFLYPYKPIRTVGNFVDERGYCMSLPKELFIEQKWEDEPRKVIITIETID